MNDMTTARCARAMRWSWAAFAALGIVTTAATLEAQQICFPRADGVPGAPGAPDWWTPGSLPVGSMTTSFLDDPRWNGALSHNVMEYERFRVVVEKNAAGDRFLVMSWEVRADSNSAMDRLYFGFWDDASNTGNVFRLTRVQATQTPITGASGSSAFTGRVFTGTGLLGAVIWTSSLTFPPPPLPAWLTNDGRVDVSCASPPSTGCDRWAFRIRAPVTDKLNLLDLAPNAIRITGSTFRFWYEIQDSMMIGSATYAYPDDIVNAHEGGFPPIMLPDPNSWRSAKFGQGASCDNDVAIHPPNVWVNSAGNTQLNLTSNEFHALPRNNTTGDLNNNQVTARFRISDWGSVAFSSPAWKDVCTSVMDSFVVPATTRFNLRCTWSGFDSCPYKAAGDPCGPSAGTKDPHQNILVDLDNTPGGMGTLVFWPQSVNRNMDFDVNSVLVRNAVIDTRGLKPMANGADKRDIYLYVQTRNMPAEVPKIDTTTGIGRTPPTTVTQPGQPGTITRPVPPSVAGPSVTGPNITAVPLDPDTLRVRDPAALRARFKELQLPSQGALGLKASLRIQEALIKDRITLEQVELLMPTYIVNVWYDTGRMLDTEKGPVKLLEPQSSFGLFLAHDGELEGWTHQLEGARRVGENLYQITAEKDEVVRIKTTIAPKGEQAKTGIPPQTVSCNRCDASPRVMNSLPAILASLALLVLVAMRLRRRRSS